MLGASPTSALGVMATERTFGQVSDLTGKGRTLFLSSWGFLEEVGLLVTPSSAGTPQSSLRQPPAPRAELSRGGPCGPLPCPVPGSRDDVSRGPNGRGWTSLTGLIVGPGLDQEPGVGVQRPL